MKFYLVTHLEGARTEHFYALDPPYLQYLDKLEKLLFVQ